MKKIIVSLLSIALLSGCTSKTDFGKCVGLGEKQDPKLEYKVSGWNLFVGIVFIELILPPILVATDELYCPVAKVEPTK